MILVILVIGILMIILGVVLYDKLDSGKDEIGTIFQIVGTVATIISTIVAIVLLICVGGGHEHEETGMCLIQSYRREINTLIYERS